MVLVNGEKWNRFILQTKKDKKWYWKPASRDDWPFCHNVLPRVCVTLKRLVKIWSLWCFIGTYFFFYYVTGIGIRMVNKPVLPRVIFAGYVLGELIQYNWSKNQYTPRSGAFTQRSFIRSKQVSFPIKVLFMDCSKTDNLKWNYQSKNRHT